MSNLLKSHTVKCDESDKRVLDFNELISEKIVEIKASIEKEAIINNENTGFVEGIDAQKVELLLNEQTDETTATQESSVDEETLEQMNEKADSIITNANNQADSIIDNARIEAENIKNNAFEEGRKLGYEEGIKEGRTLIDEEKANLEVLRNNIEIDRKKAIDELEPQLVNTILDVFEKVTHVLSDDKKELILQLVDSAITQVDIGNNFIVRVSKDDGQYVKEHKEEILNSVDRDIHVDIVEDITMKKNQCLIETDYGIYDCSLDTQLENLIREIRLLSCAITE